MKPRERTGQDSIANEAPAWLGNLVYAYGALRALLSWHPARFEIANIDSAELDARTLIGAVASVAMVKAN